MPEQTFLRDGKWLTVAQIKQYNKARNKKLEPVVVEEEPVIVEELVEPVVVVEEEEPKPKKTKTNKTKK